MLRNYLIVSLRNLHKHLSYSLINITGLAVGLATCLLLVTWIRHELSFDRFHANAEHTYRVSMEYSFGGQVARPSVSPNALLPALLEMPETRTGVRIYNTSTYNPVIVKYGNKIFEENRFYFADSAFFDVFSFKMESGQPSRALSRPYSIVLTKSMARKYFGDEDPVGKLMVINDNHSYEVTGVMENPPTNSVLQFDCIASFNSIAAGRGEPTWWSANYQTYVVLHESARLPRIEQKINNVAAEAVRNELTGDGDYVRYNFLALTDLYLRSDFDEFETVSDIKYIYIFSGVAILILVIACINYVNLATARAAGRAREVGVRKVAGALRKQLFIQFIGESIVITSISFAAAIALAALLLPIFNSLVGKQFTHAILFEPNAMVTALGGMVFIALAAGAYPAIALTGFNPVQVLKGNFKSSARGVWLRKGLVVFQFAISAILIAATLIIVTQLGFIRNKKLGYDRENVIVLPLDAKTDKIFESLKAELKRSGFAQNVSRASESPVNILAGYGIKTPDREGAGIITAGLLADEEYLPTLDIELLKGRNFTAEDLRNFEKDTLRVFIVNESALKELFIDEQDAVGTRVSVGEKSGEIIGVIKDFHFASLHRAIGPLVIFPEREQFSKILIKLPAGPVDQSLARVEKMYRQLVAHRPFEFDFLDQQYNQLYQAETRMGSIASVFASLAIIIACLGLFGLVSFAAEQRKREISIRKVLGANPSGIVLLISRDFSKLIVLAILIGLPGAYWLLNNFWLEGFAYRAEMGVQPFVLAAVACIVIAFASTAYQSVKASLVNPATTLRNE